MPLASRSRAGLRPRPTLSLTFERSEDYEPHEGPPGTTPGWEQLDPDYANTRQDPGDLAGIIGTLHALARLTVASLGQSVPLADLVALWANEERPPTSRPDDYGHQYLDVWWAVRRTWGGQLPPPAERPDVLSLGQEYTVEDYGRHVVDYIQHGAAKRPIRIVRIEMRSPLQLVASLPWEWFAPAGGGLVFLKAVEMWLNVPGRIRLERSRLQAEAAAREADLAEAQLRQETALRRIEQLRIDDAPTLIRGSVDNV